ncbi:glyoxalase superfamily protein [Arthrobacter sp. ISL-30]|uniref:glyoxalase superfamily protein n=1 Tax=Arthrobacter sp. ISL-30 TaxID=2819109 RepID=UPI001BED0785|nr:glyoxalase superfamily protein [Arthrobacter sp. ISL-30]MBT2513296.1 VOC family protein [Arthrobacter sp. ISL-30]
MDWKLELVYVPVSDVDRAKDFYVNKVGFNADHDHRVNDSLRFVQLTPPGSGCSIAIGEGMSDAPPGTAPSLQLVVNDIQAAYEQLKGNGVDVSDIEVLDWGHFVYFADPDGNKWAVQYIPYRDSKASGDERGGAFDVDSADIPEGHGRPEDYM